MATFGLMSWSSAEHLTFDWRLSTGKIHRKTTHPSMSSIWSTMFISFLTKSKKIESSSPPTLSVIARVAATNPLLNQSMTVQEASANFALSEPAVIALFRLTLASAKH